MLSDIDIHAKNLKILKVSHSECKLPIINFAATKLVSLPMIQIRNFVFNPFQVNTYVLYDETGEAVIIDPACYDKEEEAELADFLLKENLKPVLCLSTHTHIDHVLGNNFIFQEFKLKPVIHEAGLDLLKNAAYFGKAYGFHVKDVVQPESYLIEGQIITFGNSKLEVLYTPGHANGSVCFLCRSQKFVIVGDVLFYESIGRTDLPGGNYEMLANNIKTKLFVLEDEYKVYSGHGHETTIGHEKRFNPFLNGEIEM